MNTNYHIEARVTILETVDSPKVNGIRSGYMPHHKFPRVDCLVSGKHDFGDTDAHYPGECLTTRIGFPGWEFIANSVSVGEEFQVLELERLVAEGIIMRVIGQDTGATGE